MATRQTQKYCKNCGKKTLFEKQLLNTLGGIFLTVITFGLFIPIWLVNDWFLASYRCQTCGGK